MSFDPSEIGHRDHLEVFLAVHDPTTKNRQGHDVGHPYRSVIFYGDERQPRGAEETVQGLKCDPSWQGTQLVTELERLTQFYPAEAYHEGYFRRNPEQIYCQVVIGPQVAKFQKPFAARLSVPGRS